MTKLALAAALLTCGLLGCRTPHLGADTGRAYRKALAEQGDGTDGRTGPALTADDARQVMGVHRSGPRPATAGGAGGGTSSATTSTTTTSTGTSPWPGATGPIQLEAK